MLYKVILIWLLHSDIYHNNQDYHFNLENSNKSKFKYFSGHKNGDQNL